MARIISNASGATSAAITTQQPSIRPSLRCRPERVSGIPICLESLDLAAEMPSARFQEKENPYFFTFRVDTHNPHSSRCLEFAVSRPLSLTCT
jgi:hypothetical protein